MLKVTAIIVAKKVSTRVPNKNMLPFGNSTLLGHKISQLLQCDNVTEVVVGSDSDDILDFCKQFNVITVKRPDHVCVEPMVKHNEMIENMISLIPPTDVVMWSHCTNPNIQPLTYYNAINKFLCLEKEYNSLISVDKVQEHLWDNNFTPTNYNPWDTDHTLARDLPVLWKQNGAIFIQTYENIKNNGYFFGSSPFLFETPILESGDIDTKEDFFMCQTLHKKFFELGLYTPGYLARKNSLIIT